MIVCCVGTEVVVRECAGDGVHCIRDCMVVTGQAVVEVCCICTGEMEKSTHRLQWCQYGTWLDVSVREGF